MKLLHIDAGITGPNSVSRQLSGAIVEALAKADPSLQIVSRDLDADPIPHLDGGDFGLRAVEGSDDKAARAAAVLQEFLDADIVVIGAPRRRSPACPRTGPRARWRCSGRSCRPPGCGRTRP